MTVEYLDRPAPG
jgi:hypothetical protein